MTIGDKTQENINQLLVRNPEVKPILEEWVARIEYRGNNSVAEWSFNKFLLMAMKIEDPEKVKKLLQRMLNTIVDGRKIDQELKQQWVPFSLFQRYPYHYKQRLLFKLAQKQLDAIPHDAQTQRIINVMCSIIFGILIVIGVVFYKEIINFVRFK